MKSKRHVNLGEQSPEIQLKPPALPKPPLVPLSPTTIRISCELTDDEVAARTKQMRGMHTYGVDLTCNPEGDLFLSVEATRDEFLAHVKEPHVRFRVTEKGEVADAEIASSSGSKELDSRVLRQALSLKFKANHCKCRIEENVPVDSNKWK